RSRARNGQGFISILPAKGIPLPFISYGGTSVLMTMLAVGVLLNISQNAGKRSRAESETQVR
ncbi:MAG: FtsW/RodA/SpoVE family cell cycle protein, partial [Acidobacteriota bacterium]